MPWLALPNDATASQIKAKLVSDLHIQGIPSLVVLDVATGQFVTDAARGHVQSVANGSAEQKQQVINAWKSTTPVSFEEGLAASNDMLSLLKRAVMAVLKNPVYMFGMLYMVKVSFIDSTAARISMIFLEIAHKNVLSNNDCLAHASGSSFPTMFGCCHGQVGLSQIYGDDRRRSGIRRSGRRSGRKRSRNHPRRRVLIRRFIHKREGKSGSRTSSFVEDV